MPPSEHDEVIVPPPIGHEDIHTQAPNPEAGHEEEVIPPPALGEEPGVRPRGAEATISAALLMFGAIPLSLGLSAISPRDRHAAQSEERDEGGGHRCQHCPSREYKSYRGSKIGYARVIHNAPYGLDALRGRRRVGAAQPNLIKVLLYERPVFPPHSCREARLNLILGERVKIGEQQLLLCCHQPHSVTKPHRDNPPSIAAP